MKMRRLFAGWLLVSGLATAAACGEPERDTSGTTAGGAVTGGAASAEPADATGGTEADGTGGAGGPSGGGGGSDTGPAGTGGAAVAEGAFAAALLGVACPAYVNCCTTSTYTVTEAPCREYNTSLIDTRSADPLVVYDASACIAAWQRVPETCFHTDLQAARERCAQVFVGTLPEGAACQSTAQCGGLQGGYMYCAGLLESDDGQC